MSGEFQNVHIRVNDAETGKPTPVRIRFAGADGSYYAPFGRLTEFGTGPAEDVGGNILLGEKKFAYIDGTCEISLPIGRVEIEIHKGPEYRPLFETVNLPKGKLAMRFTIERWINLREKGWYSGDSHCFHLSPHAGLLEGAAEDLAVVNLLAKPTNLPGHFYARIPAVTNILAFSGQQPAMQRPGHLVAVNTLNRHELLGSLALLNCHRPVFPLTFGPPDGVDDWNLADWCEQCHRKNGLVVALDFFEKGQNDAGEILADIVLNHVDVLDVNGLASNKADSLEIWYQLQQCGLRIPLSGGSGKSSNLQQLGRLRTYARLPPESDLTYNNWIEAVRAGNSFVSNGPLLSLAVNSQGPGSVLKMALSDDKILLQAEAESLEPFGELEVISNGNVVGRSTEEMTSNHYSARIEKEIPISESGWICARCSPANVQRSAVHAFAHTSALYLEIANQPFQPDGRAVEFFLDTLESNRSTAIESGTFANNRQRSRMAAIYIEARTILSQLQG